MTKKICSLTVLDTPPPTSISTGDPCWRFAKQSERTAAHQVDVVKDQRGLVHLTQD